MRVFKVKTVWVNPNAFYVGVEQYERSIKRSKWPWGKDEIRDVHVESFGYASWESFMECMWMEHLIGGKSVFEIDSKI